VSRSRAWLERCEWIQVRMVDTPRIEPWGLVWRDGAKVATEEWWVVSVSSSAEVAVGPAGRRQHPPDQRLHPARLRSPAGVWLEIGALGLILVSTLIGGDRREPAAEFRKWPLTWENARPW